MPLIKLNHSTLKMIGSRLALFLMATFLLGIEFTSASQYVVLDALEDHSGESYKEYLSKIPIENRVLVTCSKWMTEEKKEAVSCIFPSIIEIEDYHLSASVEDALLNLHKVTPIRNIITAATEEFDIIRAGSLREYFGINGQHEASALVFRNKILMKDLVQQNGFKVPAYQATNSGMDLVRFVDKHGFPIITKPRTGVGSIKTIVIKNQQDLRDYLKSNYNCHYHSNLMVESFINGHVYQIDGLYQDGKIYAWPSKYVNSCLDMALEGKILGSHLLSAQNPLTKKLITYANGLVRIFPVQEQMPFHLEVFVTDSQQEIVFCEIASRIGGHVNKNWKYGLNIDLEQTFYDMQSGFVQDQATTKIKGPDKIIGWLLFPAKHNCTIMNMAQHCPLDFCIDYETFMNIGDSLDNPLGICSNLAKAYIRADSEEDFDMKANQLMTWFQENLSYKDANNQG